MTNYNQVIENSKAYKIILQDKKQDKLSHTYLLISEDQEYCHAFAKNVAKIILDAENKEQTLVKIEKDIHPDVIVLGKNEKISTEMASNLSSDVYVRPFEEDNKIYVLLNLDDTQEEAQNKLLKTIEEPPKSVFFLLCAKTERKLLQTVLSRSKKIELDLLTIPQIQMLLEQNGVDKKTAEICSACSAGVFARAYKMATDKEFLELYQNVYKCLYEMNSSRDVLKFASIFSQKNVNKDELSDIFMLLVRDLIMVKVGKSELVQNIHLLSQMKLICEGFSISALYKIVEYCLQLKEDLVYNTNSVEMVDEFLLKIVEAKVKCKK